MNDSDRLDQLVSMVHKLRQSQIVYFRTRGGLDECKKIERAVDRWLKDYAESKAGQTKLF